MLNISRRSPRCLLVNVASGESMTCLLNPTQMNEAIQVYWRPVVVPGLSHAILQYQSTDNRIFSGVEFYFDKFFSSDIGDERGIISFRDFLRSLTVPPERGEDVLSMAPPRVLVIWPKVITVEAVVTQVEFEYQQFSVEGDVLVYSAFVTFEEILDVRITSEQRRKGE